MTFIIDKLNKFVWVTAFSIEKGLSFALDGTNKILNKVCGEIRKDL